MIKKLLLTIMVGSLLTACASTNPYYAGQSGMNKTVIGAGLGAATGAALGTAFGGNDLGNAGLGALAGGAVGAAVGAYVDHRQKQQQQNGWYQNAPYGYER